MSTERREQSRGRAAEYHSSGRGGLGNIRASSTSQTRPTDGPDDFSKTRGRELYPSSPLHDEVRLRSTGRGGAGNMRSPSRDAVPVAPDVIERQHDEIHSTGRGGLGNIKASRSRSRDPALDPHTLHHQAHSTGRGGLGNIREGPIAGIEPSAAETHARADAIHSTGRGGAANHSSLPSPPPEEHPHAAAGHASHGRGGWGNISAD